MVEAYQAVEPVEPVETAQGPSEAVRADLGVAAVVAAALALLGAALGLVWSAWSPPGPAADVLGGGQFVPDETESFVAGDGRFVILALAVGVVAAVLAWTSGRNRGALMLTALVVGGLLGSLLMELVGHLSGGGSFTGAKYRFGDGSVHEVTKHLPLSLHAQGLLFIEPAIAALGYGMFVAFTARDDLGRPDPVRDALTPLPVDPSADASVASGDHPQDGWGYGNAAGPLQQGDLPPQ